MIGTKLITAIAGIDTYRESTQRLQFNGLRDVEPPPGLAPAPPGGLPYRSPLIRPFEPSHEILQKMEGIAIWLPSDNYPMSFLKLLRSVPMPVFFGLGWESGQRMKSFGDYIDGVHKRLTPYKHWFLQTIAVDPQFQGKGYAGKLLRPMLARMDEECLPCYLETIDEENVSLYEHFGFKVVDKSAVPKTNLTNWAMLRRAPQDTR